MSDIETALASLNGQAWGLISKLTGKGYDNKEDQYRDMQRVGAIADQIMQLRTAQRVLASIPDKEKAQAKPAGRRGASVTVATPEPKGPGITPLGQVTGDGKAHTVANPDDVSVASVRAALDNLPGESLSDPLTSYASDELDLTGEDA